jgi:membrane carboxypeptidase/penicillin-binding protein
MGKRPSDYDPRIQMVSTYQPPLPKNYGKRRRWPKRLLVASLSLVVLVGGLFFGVVFLLGSDPALPRLDRLSAYHPQLVTHLQAATGEPIGEIVGERRTLVPPGGLPDVVKRALVEKQEPGFLTRKRLASTDLLRALMGRLRGRPEAASMTLALSRNLTAALKDRGLTRWIKEWLVALRLERALSRDEILWLYANQMPFGQGRFGVEEGARALFDRSVSQLDAGQAAELASWAGSKAPHAHDVPSSSTVAPAFAAVATKTLSARYDAEELARVGATVVTTCDLALSRQIEASIRGQRLQKSGLHAVVVVEETGTGVVKALVTGPTGEPTPGSRLSAQRPIGALRAPLVLAAALQSLKWTPASRLGQEPGEPLRAITLKSPDRAVELLLQAGLRPQSVLELGTNAGLTSAVEADALAEGKAGLTPLETASVLATVGGGGARRQPQLLRTIDGKPESAATRATLSAMTPETAWLVTSLLPLSSSGRRGTAGVLPAQHGTDAWFGAFTPERVVVVRVGFDDGRGLPTSGEAQRAATAIGLDVLGKALAGVPTRTFARPPGLVLRRLDPKGDLYPSTATTGTEEWFVPGSLPREELPPPDEARPAEGTPEGGRAPE